MKKRFLSFIIALCLIIPSMFVLTACGNKNKNNNNGDNSGGENNNGGNTSTSTVDPNWPKYDNVTYDVSNVVGGVILEDVNFTRQGEFPQEFHVPKFVNGKKVVRIASGAFSDVYQDPYLGHNADSFNDAVHNFPYNKIIVPATVEYVDSGAFTLCTAKEIEFQGANTQFGNSLGGQTNSMFMSCWLLEKVTLPANLDLIHHQMFYNCKSLTDVVIPESVTKIEWLAFANCESLVTITIPANVQEIESAAFTDCYKLKTVYIKGNPTIYIDVSGVDDSFDNCGVNREFEFIYG